ncbi:T9SS type A sorting domain-containing protein [Bacteroidota bacterium]
MKQFFILSVILFSLLMSVSAQPNAENLIKKSKSDFFIENKGQWPEEVRFLAKIGGMNAWITKSGVVYDYYKIEKDPNAKEKGIDKMMSRQHEVQDDNSRIKGHVVRMDLKNKEHQSIAQGKIKQATYYNYFIGNDKSKWASYVLLYEEVTVENVYEGIDARYYYENSMIRYDFIAEPGADLSQINMNFDGQESISINDEGELLIMTSIGEVKHNKIFAYQPQDGKKAEINCRFFKKGNRSVGFELGVYNNNLPIIIDPLVYSTFIGGSADDIIYHSAIDGTGTVYITGFTFSSDYPTTNGAYDESHNDERDVFVSKLNANGTTLIYSTFIGGSDVDAGRSINIDGSGTVYLAGSTRSSDYPTTSGAFDESHNGENEVFVSKLDADGSSLIYSTFIGGSGYDGGSAIAIDSAGAAYVTGGTFSSDYPTTSGIYDESYNNSGDVFVSKLDADGSSLIYSTFIGGSGTEGGECITIDISGAVYVTGGTESSDYPTKSGAYDESFNGGADVFVSKLDADGSSLIYSTFIGGSKDEPGIIDFSIDGSGTVYLSGRTQSSDYPTTNGAYDESYNAGDDLFVSKLNADGTSLIYSTFIGGSDYDTGQSITIDGSGTVYVTGFTVSSDYPVTRCTYDESYNGGGDVFVSKLNANGTTLIYSTFIGGSGTEGGGCITIDGSGSVYLAGSTQSSDYPTTSGAFDESHNGEQDIFVSKLDLTIFLTDSISETEYCAGANVEVSYTTDKNFNSGNKFIAQLSDALGSFDNSINLDSLESTSSGAFTNVRLPDTLSAGSGYRIRVVSTDPAFIACDNDEDITISPLPTPDITDYPTNICANNEYTYTGNTDTDLEYKWSVASGTISGADDGETCNVVWGSSSSGTITLVQTNSTTGCKDSVYLEVMINPLPAPDITDYPTPVCANKEYIYTGNTQAEADNRWKVIGGTIFGADEGENVNVIWGAAGSGTITLVQTNAITKCLDSVFQVITITPLPEPSVTGDTLVCAANSYEYSSENSSQSYTNITIRWAASNGSIVGRSDTTDVEVTWGDEGIGTLKLIQTNSEDCMDSVEVNIVINQTPAKPTISQNGGILTSSANEGNQWYRDGTILTDENNKTLNTNQIFGQYTVQVTSAEGCQSEMSDVYDYTTSIPSFSISGTVYNENTNAGIPQANVSFYGYMPGGTTIEFQSSVTTNVSGNYSGTFSSEYEYKVMAEVPGGTTNYIPEYWDNMTNVLEADIITLTENVNGIDFYLGQSSSFTNQICGQVVDNADESLIPSWVILYRFEGPGHSQMAWASWSTFEATSGTFSITGLETGRYILQSQPFSDSYSPGYYRADDELVKTGWGNAYEFVVDQSSDFCPIIVRHKVTPGQGDGPGGFNGKIGGKGGGIKLKGKHDKVNAENPIRGATVYLLSNEEVIRFTFSSNLGKFDIKNLQLMGYDVIIDKVNYDEYKTSIELTEEYPVDSMDVEIEPTPVSVDEQRINAGIFVYPNPASDIINVVFNASSDNVQVRLSDCLGNVVYKSDYRTVMGFNTISIRPENITSGFYIVQIIDKNQNISIPVMITR